MGEAAGGGTRRRKKGGEGTGGGSGQKREEGNPGQSVPGVTGAQIPAPQGMWCDRGPQGGPPDPSRPLSPPGSWPNSPHPVLGWGPQGLGKAAPRPPHASPQTHSHTTVPCLGASPCQPGQGATLMPAPNGQGGQGDRAGLRGVGRWGELWAPKEEGAGRGHLLGSA